MSFWLLTRLESIGIRDGALDSFRSYLEGWKFSVRFGDSFSALREFPSRVPQGGVLSPLLFLIYTCDLLEHLKTDNRITVAGFADDIKVAATYALEEKHEAQMALNKSVEKMLSWATSWRLEINASKTYSFSLGASPIDVLFPDETIIKHREQIKDLGVMVAKNLSWSAHVDEASNKALRENCDFGLRCFGYSDPRMDGETASSFSAIKWADSTNNSATTASFYVLLDGCRDCLHLS